MTAILATVKGFLRRSFMENALLVLGVAVAVFMGATVTGAVAAYSAYSQKELADPRFAEIVARPAAFQTSQSEAATKIDASQSLVRRFIFDADTASSAMAESPAVSATYVSQTDSLRVGNAPGSFGGPPGAGGNQGATQGAAQGASSGSPSPAQAGPGGFPPDLSPEMAQAMRQEQAAQEAANAAALAGAALDTPTVDRLPARSAGAAFFSSWGLAAAEGSLYTDADVQAGKTVLVLGSGLAKILFSDGRSLGKKIMADGRVYTIIGVLAPTGLTDSTGNRSVDDIAFVPPLGVTRTIGGRTLSLGRPNDTLTFFVSDRSRIDQAVKQLKAYFDRVDGEGQVSVSSRQSSLNARRSAESALLGAVTALALLCMVVATLNIFNVSSIKTIRRRQSLGILRAIGASRVEALGCFVVEVLGLALAGTAVGLGLALPLSGPTAALLAPGSALAGPSQWPPMILVGILSMALPLAAGLFPAWRILGQAPADLVRPE